MAGWDILQTLYSVIVKFINDTKGIDPMNIRF